MKFMGSKSRIAKYIIPIIQKQIDNNNIKTYIEPFCGGCNIIDKVKCDNKIALDLNPYLIALLKEVKDGNTLLSEVPRELYNKAREAYRSGNISGFKEWEIGCIGFLASYNGRFFDGGYAKAGWESTKTGRRWRDYYQESKANILRQCIDLQDIDFMVGDYRMFANNTNCVIYCDPPYQGTKQYANSIDFDYNEFWNTVRQWSKRNIVLVSEQKAPPDFECIWEQSVNRSIKANDKSYSTEKLFMIK